MEKKRKKKEKSDTDRLVAKKNEDKEVANMSMMKQRFQEIEELVRQVSSVGKEEISRSEEMLQGKIEACQATIEEKMESMMDILCTLQAQLEQGARVLSQGHAKLRVPRKAKAPAHEPASRKESKKAPAL